MMIIPKADLFVYQVAKEDLFLPPDSRSLDFLIADLESFRRYRGRLLVFFDGYNDDPREIFEVPEIKSWSRRFFEVWPHWLWFFAHLHPQQFVFPLLFVDSILMPSGRNDGRCGVVFDVDDIQREIRHSFRATRDTVDLLAQRSGNPGLSLEELEIPLSHLSARMKAP